MNIKTIHRTIVFFITVLFTMTLACSNAFATEDEITLTFPEKVLADALSSLLPLEFPADSSTLKGKIIIKKINDVQLLDQQLRCRLHLIGDRMKILTELAGNTISLNVGTIELDFNALTSLRFDQQTQTLYVTPVVDEIHNSQDGAGGDIGQTLLAIFNGQEFPLSMKDIEPIVARAGSKTVTINTQIADIRSQPRNLLLSLKPEITTSGN